MEPLALGLGLFLLALTFWDLFETVVVPRPTPGWFRIGRYVVRGSWRVLRTLRDGRPDRSYARVLGFFAPRVETALSGAGWETTGSQSVQARQLIDKNFKGLSSYGLMTVLYSPTKTVSNPSFEAAITNVERTLRADAAVGNVIPPTAGMSISRDGARRDPASRRRP